MEVKKATEMLEDAMYDDYFASKCMDWYANDIVFVLSRTELDALHKALSEWVVEHKADKKDCVALMNKDIECFFEDEKEEDNDIG